MNVRASRQTEHPHLAISTAESWTIDFVRIVCIGFMVWVHVYPGVREPSFVYNGPAHLLWVVVIDVLGRASVATLSFFSGYVLFVQLQNRRPSSVITDRFRSIFVPMVTWNLIALFSVWTGLHLLEHGPRTLADFYEIRSAWDYPSLLLALDRQPANLPIGFLRDLFVTIVMLVALRQLLARWGVVALVLLAGIAAFRLSEPLILRPSITLFALGGFVCASFGWTLTRMSEPRIVLPAIGLFGGLFAVSLSADTAHDVFAQEMANLTKRAALTGLMLLIGTSLARHWAHVPVDRWRTVLFVTFLSHGILSEVFGEAFELAGGSVRSPSYLLFFFAMPFAFLAAGAVLDRLIDRLPAPAQMALRGTRSARTWSLSVAGREPVLQPISRRPGRRL